MKIVPSEFSNSAWNCFIFAKEIAYKNYQQNVDSDNLLLALIKDDNITKKILKKNNVNLKDLEREIISSLIEYKNEGYDMFLEMMTNMRRNVIYSMFMFQPKTDVNEK